jgi:UDP-glucuronate 4-epimerase
VYGDSNKMPFKETFSLNPISPYGMTKVQDEEMAHFFSKQMNLNIVTLRLFTLYGPRQRPDLMLHKLFLNHLNRRESVVYKKTSRDYTYISDGVQGIKKAFEFLMENDSSDVFNIGSSNPVKTTDAVKEIKKIYPEFKYKETEKKRGDMTKTFANISKAERVLGYKPEMDFKEGLKKFSLWFNNYYKL